PAHKHGLVPRRDLRLRQRKHREQIMDVRGAGLMWGIEFYGPAAPGVAGLRAHGLLATTARDNVLPLLPAPGAAALRAPGILATKAGDNLLRLLPPLVVKRGDIESFLMAFDNVLTTG